MHRIEFQFLYIDLLFIRSFFNNNWVFHICIKIYKGLQYGECISFLKSYAKTYMNFGILLNEILLIAISYSNLYFRNILLRDL
jgi:hypothetical protein